MRLIQNKTKLMVSVEKKYNKNIEELLREMFVDEGKSNAQIAEELGISYVTAIKWMKLSGVYSRNLGLDL